MIYHVNKGGFGLIPRTEFLGYPVFDVMDCERTATPDILGNAENTPACETNRFGGDVLD